MKRPLRLLAALSSPAAIALTHAARAQDAAPAGPALIAEYAGDWQVTDAEATKTCSVTLDAEATIGGSVIVVAPDCAGMFPVMGEIAAWRLYENGDIVFADATRRERLRFYTPDDSYISVEEVDGIVRLVPLSQWRALALPIEPAVRRRFIGHGSAEDISVAVGAADDLDAGGNAVLRPPRRH